MSITWVGTTIGSAQVGYNGDNVIGHIEIDQWQEPSTFETELHEALEDVRRRMVAVQLRLHEMSGDDL